MKTTDRTSAVEPVTLEDGHVTFHKDGSTELHITIPPGRGEDSNMLGNQLDRFVTRLLELALAWQRTDEAA